MGHVHRDGGIVWVVPPSKSCDEEIDGILVELESHLAGDEPYVLLFDLTQASVPNALQRRKLAAHIQENVRRIRLRVRGVGAIVSSPLWRGVVTAVFWLAPPPVPYRVFSSRVEAVVWADSLEPPKTVAVRGRSR